MAKLTAGQIIVSVTKKEIITPHLIRVYLHGEGVEQFERTTLGDNNKILIPPEGVKQVHFPTFDAEKREWNHPPKVVAPAVRTYTHRGIDVAKQELVVDFVNHGETGPASKWALHAQVGDQLGVMMRTEPRELYPPADWYLLVGDATAIPVLSAILETLPADKKGVCIIEVHGKDDEQLLPTNADIEFIWLHNASPQNGSELADFVRSIAIPETTKFGYVAAEFSSVKQIRSYLRVEKKWQQKELYAYSYWKFGMSEDKSQSDRQAEKNTIR